MSTLTQRRRSMATAWSPARLPGLAGWWRADDLALTDGTAVASWSDRTANANTVAQATTAAKPIFHTNQVGGKPAVRFARSSSQILTKTSPTGLPDAQTGKVTVIALANLRAVQSSTQITSLAAYTPNGGHAGWRAGYVSNGSGDNWLWSLSGVKNYSGTIYGVDTTSGFTVMTYAYDSATFGVEFGRQFRKGTADTVSGTSGAASGSDTFSIGASVAGGANDYVDADIAEIIVVAGALSTIDKWNLSDYFATYYSLATGTPYNAASPLTTPSPDGSNTAIESSIIYDGTGGFVGGKNYLCAFVALNGSNANENPSLLSSADGQTWAVPSGITNPLVAYPGGGASGNNSDPSLFDNRARDGKIYLYYQRENTTPTSTGGVYVLSSSDNGATWTSATQSLAASGNDQFQEPQVMYVGGTYYLLSLNLASAGGGNQILERRSATGPTGTWGSATTCTYSLPTGKGWWHWGRILDVNGTWYVAGSDGKAGDTFRSLWLFRSDDNGLTWISGKRPVIVPSLTDWDRYWIYRGNLLLNADGVNVDCWYNASASLSGGDRMAYVSIPRTMLP